MCFFNMYYSFSVEECYAAVEISVLHAGATQEKREVGGKINIRSFTTSSVCNC